MHKVFVYGSLKQGFHNYHLLQVAGVRHMGEMGETACAATARAEFAMMDLGSYPGVCRVEHGGIAIHGEVYMVTDEVLARLDRLEGHPNYYRREPVEVTGYGECLMYILNPDSGRIKAPLVASGDWGCEKFGQGIACDCGPCESMQATLERGFQ